MFADNKETHTGLVLTALRGTGKDFMVAQINKTVSVPWNWHILCKSVTSYQQLLPLLKKVRRYAYADAIKVQDFDHVVSNGFETHDFISACDDVQSRVDRSSFTRNEKIAVYDILKHTPFWRQCLINRGMAGRAEDPNKWVNPTLDEIEAYYDSTAENQAMIQVFDYETPVITDSRWPSEIDRVLKRFPEFKSIRLWAPDISMIDDPSENSMTEVLTDYVFIRAPLTPTDEPTTPGYLLDQFKKAHPQYKEYGVYVCQ